MILKLTGITPDDLNGIHDVINTKTVVDFQDNDILSVEQFDRNTLRQIFYRAQELRYQIKQNGCLDILNGKVIASIFYEPSTRTRVSFSAAAKRLGSKVLGIDTNTSSVKKGETLEDFIRCIECYADLIVLRSSEVGDALKASQLTKVPIINAGDGIGEHPTQALLDIFTIREERGTVNGLTITMIGDLKHGRTVHSLAKLLSLYSVRLRYVSPHGLEIPTEVINYVKERNIEQTEHSDLNDVLEKTDILYVTRIQKERFKSEKEYIKFRNSYQITPQMLTRAKKNLVIMHPLPRVNEISNSVDNDPRAAYFRQMEYGMYVRMALLEMLIEH